MIRPEQKVVRGHPFLGNIIDSFLGRMYKVQLLGNVLVTRDVGSLLTPRAVQVLLPWPHNADPMVGRNELGMHIFLAMANP